MEFLTFYGNLTLINQWFWMSQLDERAFLLSMSEYDIMISND